MVEFTEKDGTKHTISGKNLNRVECKDTNLRIAFSNEVLRFTLSSTSECEKIYQQLKAELEKNERTNG